MFDPDSGSLLQDFISPVMVSRENTSVLSVCDYSLLGVATACLLGFTACPDCFLSCHEENDPDLKSGRDFDPHKQVWCTSCREDITDPSFLRVFFCGFRSRFHDFYTTPCPGYISETIRCRKLILGRN